jgi:solute carrier family 50 protein (sugar transporter)
MHQLPNVLGFSFGVVQMGLYALYRNATPTVLPANEVANDDAKDEAMSVDDSTFEVPGEHVATIAMLTTVPAVAELIKARDAHSADAAPAPQPPEEAKPAESGTAVAPANDVQLNAEQV